MNPLKTLVQKFANAYSSDASGGDGLMGQFQKYIDKFILWGLLSVVLWIIFGIAFLFQCSKPESGVGTCLRVDQKGLDNSFTYNLADSAAGGMCSDDIYHDVGQKIDWIDTGFETTGEQLTIYVTGRYFPWGEKQVQIVPERHLASVQTEDGTFIDTLDIVDAPQECILNTSLNYQDNDDDIVKIIYENQLNTYTTWNPNNRLDDRSKILIDRVLQADCIDGYNCSLGTKEEYPVGCVLQNGQGIYMRIGNEAEFAYHLVNHFIPKLKQDCEGRRCKYIYDKSGTKINMTRIPFGLPTIVFDHTIRNSSFIKDIRGKVESNLVPITSYGYDTDYRFITILPAEKDDPNAGDCINAGYQKIGDTCYKSVEKVFTHEELQEHRCVHTTKEILMPDELCKPQKGKRIWIKPADTCYDDNDGVITLTFASGAKNMIPKFEWETKGFRITWIQKILLTIMEPFWGSQTDKEKIDDVIEISRDENNRKITIKHKNDDELYFSKSDGNYVIKSSKYDQSGLVVKDVNGNKTTNIAEMGYAYNGNVKNKIIITIKSNTKTSVNDIDFEYVSMTATVLVKINDMNNGLFVKVRNAMMGSSLFHMARMVVVVWFVFSFGLGFINKEKVLTIEMMTMNWKRFFILMWFTNPDNYDLIDELLWPSLFYGSQQIAGGILEATSSVWGTSVVAENPLSFFDDVLTMLTSKDLIYKFGAVATEASAFYMFFLLFPFLSSSCLDVILMFLIPIISISFTVFSIGQIIMFMPLFALMSLFNYKADVFKTTLISLISDFVHFAFALGFFGLFIGFAYHKILDIINVEVCWRRRWHINFFGLYHFERYDWMFNGSAGQKIKTIWGMIKDCFSLALVLKLVGTLAQMAPEYMANVFAKGAGLFGLQKATQIDSLIGKFASKSMDGLKDLLKDEEPEEKAKKEQKQELDKGGGKKEEQKDDKNKDNDKKSVKRSGAENQPENNQDETETKNPRRDEPQGGKKEEEPNENNDEDEKEDKENEPNNKEPSKEIVVPEVAPKNSMTTNSENVVEIENDDSKTDPDDPNNPSGVASQPIIPPANANNNPLPPSGGGSENGSKGGGNINKTGGLPKLDDDFEKGGGISRSNDDWGIQYSSKKKIDVQEDEEILLKKTQGKKTIIIHHKKKMSGVKPYNEQEDEIVFDGVPENDAGGMIADTFEKAGVQDSLADAGVKDGLTKAGVKDGLTEAGVKDPFAGNGNGGDALKAQEQKAIDNKIAENEKIISKTKMKVKAVGETMEDIDAKIIAKLKQIKKLNDQKFANAGNDNKVNKIIGEKNKLEKVLKILQQKKAQMESNIKSAKNDSWNLKKKKK